MITDLEHVAGFDWCERRGRKVVSTQEALALYEEVARSFVGMAENSRVIANFRDFRKGSLLVAGLPALAMKFLPDVIADFIAEEPDISVSFRARSSQAVLRHLSSQEFDLGFATIDTDHPAVLRKPAFPAGMLAVLPIDQSHGAEIGTRHDTDLFLAKGVACSRMVAEVQLSASFCEMVAAGAGIWIVVPVTASQPSCSRHC